MADSSSADIFDINAVIETARQVVTQPRTFFESMPRGGGYMQPVIFVASMGLAAGVIASILSLFTAGHVAGVSIGLASVILFPLMAVIGCFIAAAIFYVIWKLMGSSEGYETAYRCIAFSSVAMPVSVALSIVPYLGTLVVTAWGFYLLYLATLAVHRIEQQKAMLVIGIIAVISILANLSGERTQRHYEERMEEFNAQMNDLQNMTPEELGEAAGEFLKGMQQATEESSEN